MKLRIAHTTQYAYDAPIAYALQQVRLTPQNMSQQRVLNWQIEIEGGTQELSFVDHHNNTTLLVSAEAGVTEIKISVEGEVETLDGSGVLGFVYGLAPLWHFQQPTERTAAGKRIRSLAKIVEYGNNALPSLHALSAAILEAVPYRIGDTLNDTPAEEAVAGGSGVCQDHAQIFVSAAREAGLPARYISGYLMMNDRVAQDATHAWAEAHVDGLGWVGFDVSNGISPDERYVRIAVGRDAREASPISGMRRGPANETMIVSVQVQQ